MACRQIAGKSWSTTLSSVTDGQKRKTNWIYLSVGARQAKELYYKVSDHLDYFSRLVKSEVNDVDEADFVGEDGTYSQTQIELKNGTRHIFLPANPDTARGYSGNVYLDEFAFHKNSDKIWTSLYPIVTRHPNYRIRITSSPNGKDNMFYRLWNGDYEQLTGRKVWERHKTDIYDAIKEGYQVDVDELRAGLANDLAWAQEYELKFIDEATSLLPYSLIESCEDWKATFEAVFEVCKGPLYVGFDVGRRGNPSVIWVLEGEGDILWTRAVIKLRNETFGKQKEQLFEILQYARHAAIDETGLGMQLAEEAEEMFGDKVSRLFFTSQNKEMLASGIRREFDDKGVRIPVDLEIRKDLHSVRQTTTSSGRMKYDAANDGLSHADHFWALALAIYAARQQTFVPYSTNVVAAASGRNVGRR
jgi:phage FluMu gp28-like protein